MNTFSILLTICDENSPVTGRSPFTKGQYCVVLIFHVNRNDMLNKQSSCRSPEPTRPHVMPCVVIIPMQSDIFLHESKGLEGAAHGLAAECDVRISRDEEVAVRHEERIRLPYEYRKDKQR